MSKTRDTGFLGNVVKVDASGNVSFVSGSTTLATINTSGQLSGSSPVLSASYASNAELLDGLDSTVFTLTSSFNAQTASFTAFSASILTYTGSVNSQLSALQTTSGSNITRLGALEVTSGSNITRLSSIETVTGSNITRLSALEVATGSLYSYTSSLNLKTASFATTGSNTFIGTQTISGSVLQSGSFTTTGTIIAQTINVQTVTSSIVYSSGSNIFGNDIGNTQTFTGSVLVTGSLTISGGSSASSYSGATIYGSTAVCSPVGLFSGCVGIGTTTPKSYSSLTTAGHIISLNNIGIDSGQSFRLNNYYNSGTGTDRAISTGYGASIGLDQINGAFTFSISSISASADSNITTTERMRISCGGNVGIGTDTPTDGKLVISQAAVASTYKTYLALVSTLSYTDTSMGIDFINRGVGGDLSGRISVIREGSAVNYGMAFGTNLSNVYCQRLYISSCGCVGIGCNTPGYTLDVKGSGHFISDGATMLIESTQQTNSSILKIVQCANGGNGNTDQGLVVQTNAADGTSNIANFYDYNSGSPVSRVRFLKNGITCFQNTVCVAGQVSSEDVRIYRSAGTTTGYINFGSTGTNYLGFDGTRFSINGSINAGGATFSDVGDTCLVLRTTNSGNPRFKFCGAAGVFNRSAAADIMYFGESSDTGLYLFRGGTLMSDKGACTGTYGFTHCGAGKWGRIGLPNTSFMYLETNAAAGVYVDAALQVGGTICSSGQVKGSSLFAGGPACGSGWRLGGSTYNTAYEGDGLWGTNSTPNFIQSPVGYGIRMGYTDNGSGLYGAAYGFDVSYKDGLNNCIDYNAIIMRNSGQGTTPFRVTSYGNIYGTSKNFRIKHPIPSMNDTHYLIHTSIEGPQADLIYRGKVQLVNGKAEVNIDLASRMTDGTFEALCQDVQSYTTNESGWSLTKSYVVENILHIEAQDETSDDTISWLVIGERNDDGIKNSAITDENGHVIVEELKPEEGL